MSLLPQKSVAKFLPAQNGLFDEVINPKLCSLMMVILRCNVFVHGMKGVSVKTLAKMIDNEKIYFADAFSEDVLFASLRQQLIEKNGLRPEEVDCYISAIVYKPTNTAPNMDNDGKVLRVRSYPIVIM
jgi:hypothetical protein